MQTAYFSGRNLFYLPFLKKVFLTPLFFSFEKEKDHSHKTVQHCKILFSLKTLIYSDIGRSWLLSGISSAFFRVFRGLSESSCQIRPG